MVEKFVTLERKRHAGSRFPRRFPPHTVPKFTLRSFLKIPLLDILIGWARRARGTAISSTISRRPQRTASYSSTHAIRRQTATPACPSPFSHRHIRCTRRHIEQHDKSRQLNPGRVFSAAAFRTGFRPGRVARLNRAGGPLRRRPCGRIAGMCAKLKPGAA